MNNKTLKRLLNEQTEYFEDVFLIKTNEMQDVIQRQNLEIRELENKIKFLTENISDLVKILNFSIELNTKGEFAEKEERNSREFVVEDRKNVRVNNTCIRIYNESDIPELFKDVIRFDTDGCLELYTIVSGNNKIGYQFDFKKIQKGLGYYVKVSESQARGNKLGLRATFKGYIDVKKCTIIEPGIKLENFPNLHLIHSSSDKWCYINKEGKNIFFVSKEKGIITDNKGNVIEIADCDSKRYRVLDTSGKEIGYLKDFV